MTFDQLDHFLNFITSPYIVQDLPFGERLKSGKSYLKSDYKVSVMLKGLPILANTGSLIVYKVELLNQGRENITLL